MKISTVLGNVEPEEDTRVLSPHLACTDCQKCFRGMKTYRNHMLKCPARKVQGCGVGECSFSGSRVELTLHHETVHGFPNCNCCQKYFSTMSSWKQHIRACKMETCRRCNTFSGSHAELGQHIRYSDCGTCSVCQTSFDNLVNIQRHEASCSRTVGCLIPNCTQMVNHQQQEHHFREAHNFPNCPFCNKELELRHWVQHVPACDPQSMTGGMRRIDSRSIKTLFLALAAAGISDLWTRYSGVWGKTNQDLIEREYVACCVTSQTYCIHHSKYHSDTGKHKVFIRFTVDGIMQVCKEGHQLNSGALHPIEWSGSCDVTLSQAQAYIGLPHTENWTYFNKSGESIRSRKDNDLKVSFLKELFPRRWDEMKRLPSGLGTPLGPLVNQRMRERYLKSISAGYSGLTTDTKTDVQQRIEVEREELRRAGEDMAKKCGQRFKRKVSVTHATSSADQMHLFFRDWVHERYPSLGPAASQNDLKFSQTGEFTRAWKAHKDAMAGDNIYKRRAIVRDAVQTSCLIHQQP
jgi:hypothetical protein